MPRCTHTLLTAALGGAASYLCTCRAGHQARQMAGARERPVELRTQHTLGRGSGGPGFTPKSKGMLTSGTACILSCALGRGLTWILSWLGQEAGFWQERVSEPFIRWPVLGWVVLQSDPY